MARVTIRDGEEITQLVARSSTTSAATRSWRKCGADRTTPSRAGKLMSGGHTMTLRKGDIVRMFEESIKRDIDPKGTTVWHGYAVDRHGMITMIAFAMYGRSGPEDTIKAVAKLCGEAQRNSFSAWTALPSQTRELL